MSRRFSAILTIYAAKLNSSRAVTTGYRRLGDAQFALQPETEQNTYYGTTKESGGLPVDGDARISSYAGTLTLSNFDAETLAWGLAGSVETKNITEALAETSQVTIYTDGSWSDIGCANIDNVLVDGFTDGTDFEVNKILGLIRPMDADKMTAGDVTVTYDRLADTGKVIKLGTEAQIRLRMLLDGKNTVTGEEYDGFLDSVMLSTSSEINLVSEAGGSEDGETITFDCTLETLPGKTHPGEINGFGINHFLV